jgi:hypothetical protein
MFPVGSLRRAHWLQVRDHAPDFRQMMFARRNRLAHAKQQIPSGNLGELEAVHAKAGAAGFGNRLHAGKRQKG